MGGLGRLFRGVERSGGGAALNLAEYRTLNPRGDRILKKQTERPSHDGIGGTEGGSQAPVGGGFTYWGGGIMDTTISKIREAGKEFPTTIRLSRHWAPWRVQGTAQRRGRSGQKGYKSLTLLVKGVKKSHR